MPLSISATSGLEVTVISTTPNVCSVEKNSAGRYIAKSVSGITGDTNVCQLTASQAGNDRWAAAANVSKSFNYKRIAQAITFTLPSKFSITANLSETFAPPSTTP